MKISPIGFFALVFAITQVVAQPELQTFEVADGLEQRWMENGKLSENKGVSVTKIKKNADGNEEMISRFDKLGNPADVEVQGVDYKKYRYSVEKYDYNDQGKRTQIQYFDKTGKPAMSENGWATAKFVPSDKKDIFLALEESYFDEKGKPVMIEVQTELFLKNSFWRVVRKVTTKGEIFEEQYLTTENKPAKGPGGYSLMKSELKGDKILKSEFFDEKDKLVNTVQGYAVIKIEAEKNAGPERTSYFDKNGVAVEIPIGSSGLIAHSILREYDENGNEIVVSYFDKKGNYQKDPYNGACIIKSKYTKEGKLAESSFFDANNKPLRMDNFPAVVKYLYDAEGAFVECRNFDADGKPFNSDTGSDDEP